MAVSQAGSCRGWGLAVPAGARCLAFLFFLCLWVGGIAIWCRWLRCGQCCEHGGASGLPVSALLSEGAGCVLYMCRVGTLGYSTCVPLKLAAVLTACRAGHAQ